MRQAGKRRLAAPILSGLVALLVFAGVVRAQSQGELNRRLTQIEPQVRAGQSDPAAASDAIDQLDAAETQFAQLAEGREGNRDELLATYHQLESLLETMYSTYQKKKDDCIETIDNGGSCDYDQPEQLALRAVYPLSWLRFEGAALYSGEPATARRLLNQAIDGFTDSSLLILSPELIRENLLGRAFAERELGKYDRAEYAKAIADFKRIMNEGAGTRQYQPAEQGLATTYAAMGKLNEAQGLTSHLAQNAPSGPQKNGLEMLHLRELFRAEAAAGDPAQRVALHKQIIDFARARENDKDGWAIAVASAAQYVSDPTAEFGASGDAFENWYLANILYYKHQPLAAAKYYWEAAKSGKYPKAYKYAADLYYLSGRYEMVAQVADAIASQPGNPDAQWAAYMRYKIPRLEWERGGMKNPQLETAWVAAAEDYLRAYPHGEYAFEPRFRLGQRLQARKDYVGAAQQYEQVTGNPDYEFTARFNAADAYYQALGGKLLEDPHAAAARAVDPHNRELRAAAIKALREAIALEPAAERGAAEAQRQSLHESRGHAIYMLATLLQGEPAPDYRSIATILDGFETNYPSMKAHFDQTFEWRIEALDHIGDYAALDREAKGLAARDTVGTDLDYIKEIGLDFWHNGAAKLAAGDEAGFRADARLTAETYAYFERMVNEGKLPAKNLTGTLSILGRAYMAMNQPQQAEAVFSQLVTADPGSPDANAGLAQIAQNRKDYKDALDLWSRVEAVAAESDPLFYESKYQLAQIYAQEGNAKSACNKLTVTRGEHPSLGSPAMKSRWNGLEQRLCQNRTEG
ncbi:MAG TPA: tetratricopeptide repeat protein [Candidatus Binataceae bacterium]|nr:tetratricopeptide repeat protein [Candidatus Binataceae bacterium]